jgi:hypothetical protein
MSYQELAGHLHSVGSKVANHHEKMEGIPLAKAAQSLQNAILRFEKKLDDFLEGRGPGIRELEELLKSPQAKAHLPLPGLNIISQSLLGEKLKADKLAAAKKEFFERVKKEGVGERGVTVLKDFFFKAAQMPPPGEDKVSLQNELLRLGSLSEEELEFEFSHRLKSPSILKGLARANSLPISRNPKKAELIETITHYARRAHANIAHRKAEIT